MYGWRAFPPVLVHLTGVRSRQDGGLYLGCNGAVLFQVGNGDAKRYGPGGIWSKYKLRGAHTGLRRKAVLNSFTQLELQMISIRLIGCQNNDLCKIGVREFWIVRKEEARSARPDVSRNNLRLGLQPQPILYFFRTRGGGFYAAALWQRSLYQKFRPIGLRKELLLEKSHTCKGGKKDAQNDARNQNLPSHRPGD